MRTQGWSRDNIPLAVGLSEASLQTFQDAELLQMCAKFEQMFYSCVRGFVLGQSDHIGSVLCSYVRLCSSQRSFS